MFRLGLKTSSTYVKKFKSDAKELQYAVEDHLYPPAICHDVVQSEVPRHLAQVHYPSYLRCQGRSPYLTNQLS